MRFAGNVIWFIFGGAITALFWLFGAAVFAVSIVGLPLTRAAIEMAKLSAWPFGREVVHVRELDGRELDGTTALTGTIGFIFNLLWAVTFGLALCLSYIAIGILWCITLIGIPFGLQSFKLAGISLWPVGRRVVTAELAHLARTSKAEADFARHRDKGANRKRQVIASTPLARRMEPALAAPDIALEPPPPRPRAAAAAPPPQLAPDRGWFVEVVGEASYQPTIAAAAASPNGSYEGKPLIIVTLEPEDDNPHDASAVRIDFKGETVGYLPRPAAREYRSAVGARRATCSGLIHGGEGENDDGEPMRFGIWVNAAWPPRFK